MLPLYQFEKQAEPKSVLGVAAITPCFKRTIGNRRGSIFAMPVARVASVHELPAPRTALVVSGGDVLSGPGAGTLVVGAEREGLPDEVVAACEAVARIEIAGDSLNAAMAATIALYEWTRVPAG